MLGKFCIRDVSILERGPYYRGIHIREVSAFERRPY